MFKEFKAKLELESGKKIKCLRTDNGGEYVDGDFLTFCKQAGIQRQFTVAYTPQQNGVAERMNRTGARIVNHTFHTRTTNQQVHWVVQVIPYVSKGRIPRRLLA
ncbi:hypothetical protein AHAS_Ahas15G0294000 [Arachis hypogaea]